MVGNTKSHTLFCLTMYDWVNCRNSIIFSFHLYNQKHFFLPISKLKGGKTENNNRNPKPQRLCFYYFTINIIVEIVP